MLGRSPVYCSLVQNRENHASGVEKVFIPADWLLSIAHLIPSLLCLDQKLVKLFSPLKFPEFLAFSESEQELKGWNVMPGQLILELTDCSQTVPVTLPGIFSCLCSWSALSFTDLCYSSRCLWGSAVFQQSLSSRLGSSDRSVGARLCHRSFCHFEWKSLAASLAETLNLMCQVCGLSIHAPAGERKPDEAHKKGLDLIT